MALVPLASGASAQEDRFTETTSVLAVEIPVQVLRNGEPVRGLTEENFEVLDSGQRRDLVDFEVVDLGLARAEADATAVSSSARLADTEPPPVRRHFLILFDLSFSTPQGVLRGLEGARNLLDGDLHSTDLVALAIYNASRGAQVLQPFTSDRRQLRAALGVIEAVHQRSPDEANRRLADLETTWPGSGEDPLGLTIRSFQAFAQQVGQAAGIEIGSAAEALDWNGVQAEAGVAGGRGGADGGGLVVETLADMAAEEALSIHQRRQGDVVHLAETLSALVEALGDIDGTKHLIWLSEGFDSGLLTAPDGSGTSRSLNYLREALQVFRRLGWAIQAFDLGGLREAESAGVGGLTLMARETDGDVYRNTNAVGAAMDQMLERTSVTYLLTIQPDDLPSDGSFRDLKVRVRGIDGRLDIRHREGYQAPSSFEHQSQQQRMVHAAQLVLEGVESGALDVAILAAGLPSETVPVRVPILIEVAGEGLTDGLVDEVLPAEVYAYAFDSNGGVSDLFASRLNVELAEVGQVLERGGYKVYGEMLLDPGHYDLRVFVRNAKTGAHRLVRTELTVPDGRVAGPVLLPPLFLGAESNWVTVRAGRSADGDYPFVIGEKQFMPAARGVLTSEPVYVCLMGSGLEGPDRQLNAEIRDVDGVAQSAASLKILQRGGGDGAMEYLVASLDPDELPAGDYTLSVTVKDSITEADSTGVASFRVAGSSGTQTVPGLAQSLDN